MDELEITKEFVDKIASSYKDQLDSITLFGSWAKGTQRPDSDIDLLVIMENKDASAIDGIYQEVLEVLLKYGVDLSLKIYTLDQFHSVSFMACGATCLSSMKRTLTKTLPSPTLCGLSRHSTRRTLTWW